MFPHLNIRQANKFQIEKLMQRVDKPINIPVKKEREVKPPKDFVRNVQGSSAGAGSGEFHVYRALRRKEFARQKSLDHKAKLEEEKSEYEKHLEELRRVEEEKTAKRREKRRKRKGGGGKDTKKQKAEGGESATKDQTGGGGEEDEDEDGDDDE
ncbi:hypothetical protein HDU76_009607 [Blyttiomyces sp. JEL0837]|nr:hypothetical protein HDU76_009607 [Blyttiomyces sp. JEL0837]